MRGEKRLEDYPHNAALPFDKWVSLINFRDNQVYFRNPIYLHKSYFSYYLDQETELKFDKDDLFFYSEHRIQRRGKRLFCENYGAQVSVMARYGIHPFSVAGRDYQFMNGDSSDLRYSNIKVINRYMGVEKIQDGFQTLYRATIHINGNWNLGLFDSEAKAAVAFNKALDHLSHNGREKTGIHSNYIDDLTAKEYADLYTAIRLPDRFLSHISGEPNYSGLGQ